MSLERWSFDPVHSSIGFRIRHLMIANVHGRFARWEATMAFDPDAPTKTQVELVIDAASIETHEPQRDQHLRSTEFLAVDAHPAIRFSATHIERRTLDNYEVVGDLTLRGVTRSVVLEVLRTGVAKDTEGADRVGFTVSGSLSRKDFGLTWNRVLETGGVMVGDRVTLAMDVEAVRVMP